MIRLSGHSSSIAVLCGLLLFPLLTLGQERGGISLRLWPDGAPDSNGLRGAEVVTDDGRISNISDPELLVFPAPEPNGQAVIMCPGDDYESLSFAAEGTDLAGWFNSHGITYAVLKYRNPNAHSDIPLTDAQRAVTLMRSRADEWGFQQLGIMGAAAGGHLAASVAVHHTPRTRPDFQVLLYPLVTFEGRISPGGRNMLFDMYPEEEEVYYFCCDEFVTADTPPAFIVHCEDDGTVPVSDSRLYARKLEENGVEVSLLIYPDGGHGWGFSDTFPHKADWTGKLEAWLRRIAP